MHEVAESNHRILEPLTDQQLLELSRVARIDSTTTVLDLACGKGELLSRWAQEHGSTGVGVDISEVFVAAARRRAEELRVADRVRFERGDARTQEAVVGAVDVACCGRTWSTSVATWAGASSY